MKNLNAYINETKGPKYLIKFYIKGKGNDMKYSNNWYAEIDKEPLSLADWWEVYDNLKWNFSEPDACVAWHGENSFWGTIIKNSENPDDAPSWATILKGRDLENIKKKEK
jgi:hypothetical protein